MLKINRTAVDKAIENMEMFTATKEVLKKYEAEKKALEEREAVLAEQIAQLQEKHATLLIDREVAKDDPAEYISLSTQLTKVNEEVQILLSLQEQMKGEFTALRMKYAPEIRNIYSKELSAKSEFNVNYVVEYVRYELLHAIADYAKAIKKQQDPLMPIIGEFLDDKEVMEAVRGFQRVFEFDVTNLSYSEPMKYVIERQHVFSACSGHVSAEIRNPKVITDRNK